VRERLKEKDLWAIIKDDLAQINMRKKLITLRGLNATLSSYHPQKKRGLRHTEGGSKWRRRRKLLSTIIISFLPLLRIITE
jgi:hypothetical protein